MNKNLVQIIFLIIIGIVSNHSSFAVSSAKFSNTNNSLNTVSDFDEAEIYNAFSEINDIVKYVSVNDSVTYSDIQTRDSSLLLLTDNDPAVAYNQHEKFSFNNHSAFLAGCFFGPIGMLLVTMINKGDREELNSAIWGCVTSGCVSIASLVVIYYGLLGYLAYNFLLLFQF